VDDGLVDDREESLLEGAAGLGWTEPGGEVEAAGHDLGELLARLLQNGLQGRSERLCPCGGRRKPSVVWFDGGLGRI
jgi:hypothetical protein